jgi:hypothetical protein
MFALARQSKNSTDHITIGAVTALAFCSKS